jgi:2-iminobutanoate/2-iminopropanoate deaminase
MNTARLNGTAIVVGVVVGVGLALAAQGGRAAAQSAGGRRVIQGGPATGLPFSPGIMVGNTLYLSGVIGATPKGLVPGGIEPETRQTLANIGEVLKAAGMGFQDVVSVTAYLANLSDFDRFNVVYRETFAKDPPVRTTVQVAALVNSARVELQMIAVRP